MVNIICFENVDFDLSQLQLNTLRLEIWIEWLLLWIELSVGHFVVWRGQTVLSSHCRSRWIHGRLLRRIRCLRNDKCVLLNGMSHVSVVWRRQLVNCRCCKLLIVALRINLVSLSWHTTNRMMSLRGDDDGCWNDDWDCDVKQVMMKSIKRNMLTRINRALFIFSAAEST